MKRILCFGDSNTYGYDPRSYMGSRYPEDVRWTGLLKRAGYDVINCGQNGMCVPREGSFQVIRNLISRVRPADAVTVMFGSNDLLTGASAKQTAKRMERLLEVLSEEAAAENDPAVVRKQLAGAGSGAGSGIKIILLAPPPMKPGDWVGSSALIRESEQLAAEYHILAAEYTSGTRGLLFADAGEWEVSAGFDGVHFTPEGHAAFAKGLIRLLHDAGI